MAYLVKLTKKRVVQDPATGEFLTGTRPGVVSRSSFVQHLQTKGLVKVLLSDLPTTVTDKEFKKVWDSFAESDTQEKSAVASFKSVYVPEDDVEEEPEDFPKEDVRKYKKSQQKKKKGKASKETPAEPEEVKED